MDQTSQSNWKPVLFFSLLFLFFFQLVSDFVETIYVFGLLETSVPPEIVSVLLFFSPLLLLFFRRGLPRPAILILIGSAAALRALEAWLNGSGKMLASGLGVGCLFVLLPALFAHLSQRDRDAAAEMGAGLTVALTLSVLFRSLAAGSDLSLVRPMIGCLLVALLLALLPLIAREGTPAPAPAREEQAPASFVNVAASGVGIMGALMMLYFAFASPAVLARWSDADYRLIVLLLAAALALYAAGLAANRMAWLSKRLLLAWNALFLLSGTAAILLNQVGFPAESGAYPVDQPALAIWQQVPLFAIIALSPVVLADFSWLARDVLARRPSPRALAAAFSLGALFFLLIVLAQVFTAVYDYVPVVGPWFRDRFWLVFLITGLGMALPVLPTQAETPRVTPPLPRSVFAPVTAVALLAAVIRVVAVDPAPPPPAAGETLRVLTYNIQQGYSADGLRNHEGQLEVIRALAPDLVGLQESDVARFSGGNADVVRALAEGLNMRAYYGPKTVAGTFGVALLSRYPIENPRTFFMYSLGEQTAAIEAQVTVNGEKFNILVTHLGNGGPIIQQQQVLSQLEGKQNAIAMGDFNFRPSTEQYQLTVSLLGDAWVLAGSPPTPGFNADRRIDHIFVSPGVEVRSAQYVASPASDHPALLAEIAP